MVCHKDHRTLRDVLLAGGGDVRPCQAQQSACPVVDMGAHQAVVLFGLALLAHAAVP